MSPLGFFRHIPTNLDLNPPTITVGSVSDQLIDSGNTASFNVSASFTAGASGTLSYQWYEVVGASENALPAETSTTLSLPNQVDPTNAGRKFRCYVTFTQSGNTAPAVNSPAKSNITTLSIRPFITITTQPVSQSVVANTPVTFNVVATVSSKGNLRYQWYRNNALIAGATSASYTIPSVPESFNSSSFYCVVSQGGSPPLANSVTSSTVNLSVSPSIATVRVYTASTSNGNTIDDKTYATYDLADGDSIPVLSSNTGIGRYDFEAVNRDIYLYLNMKAASGKFGTNAPYDPGYGGEGIVEIFAKKGQRFTIKTGAAGAPYARGFTGTLAGPGIAGGGRGSTDPVPLDTNCYSWDSASPNDSTKYAGGKRSFEISSGPKTNYPGSVFTRSIEGGYNVISSPRVCEINYRFKISLRPRFTSASNGFDANFEARLYDSTGTLRDTISQGIGFPAWSAVNIPDSQKPVRYLEYNETRSWNPSWGTPNLQLWYVGNSINKDVGFESPFRTGINIDWRPGDNFSGVEDENVFRYNSEITRYSQVDGSDGGGGCFLYEGGSLLACVGGGAGYGVQGRGGSGGGFNQNGTDGSGPKPGRAGKASGTPGLGGVPGRAFTPYGPTTNDYLGIGPWDAFGFSKKGAPGGSGLDPIDCGSGTSAGLYCNWCYCPDFDYPSNSTPRNYAGRNNGGFGSDGGSGGGSGFSGGGGGDDGSGGGGGSGWARPGLNIISASTGTSSSEYSQATITLSPRVPVIVNKPVISFVDNVPLTLTKTAGDDYRFIVNVQDSANFDQSVTTYQYQWFLGGVQYAGATSNSFRINPIFYSDDGKEVYCKVIATNTGGTTETLSDRCKLTVLRSTTIVRTTPSLPSTASYTFASDGGDGQVGYSEGSWNDTAEHKIVKEFPAGTGRIRFSTVGDIFGRKSNAPEGPNCAAYSGQGVNWEFDVRLALVQNGSKLWSFHDRTFRLENTFTDAANFSSSDKESWNLDEIHDIDPTYPVKLVFQFKNNSYERCECSPASADNFINCTNTGLYAGIGFKFSNFYIASTAATYQYDLGGSGADGLGARADINGTITDPNS